MLQEIAVFALLAVVLFSSAAHSIVCSVLRRMMARDMVVAQVARAVATNQLIYIHLYLTAVNICS